MGLFDGTPLERPVLCEQCGQDIKLCTCPPLAQVDVEPEVPPSKQRLSLRVEKRKRGKQVTVVSGFAGSQVQRQQLLKRLKNLCGAGGTIDEGNIEIQGSHLQRIREGLSELGYRLR